MDEVYVTGTIISSRLKSFGPDQTVSKCAGNLPEDRVYCSDFVDDCTDGARSECLPVMLPEFDLNPNLQSLSPHLDDRQIFGQFKQVHNGPSYEIQIKYVVLDRNFPTPS